MEFSLSIVSNLHIRWRLVVDFICSCSSVSLPFISNSGFLSILKKPKSVYILLGKPPVEALMFGSPGLRTVIESTNKEQALNQEEN